MNAPRIGRLAGSLAALVALALTTHALVACSDDVTEGDHGSITTFPQGSYTFARVPLNQESTRELVVRNVGSADLRISSIVWEGTDDIDLEFIGGSFEETILAPDEDLELLIVYLPTDTAPDAGDIVIASNDPEQPTLRFPVDTQELGPRIQVTPPSTQGLHFGQVLPGESETLPVLVTNVGELPLILTEPPFLSTQGDTEFELHIPDDVTFPYTLNDFTETLELEVTYAPTALGEDRDELIFISNDDTQSPYRLPIEANSQRPCIRLSTEVVEFSPPVGIGRAETFPVTITNCGAVDLTLESLSKTEDSSAVIFANEPTPLEGLVLTPDEATFFEVIYAPVEEGTDAANFILRSNAVRSEITVKVFASSTTNQCPVADARGRVLGGGALDEQVAAIPLDTLVLDGTGSRDNESNIAAYHWEITQQPTDSTSVLEVSEDGTARLFLDLAGDYEICLTVEDSAGTESCNTDCVVARATPNEKVHVQLIWSTPNDPVVGDTDGTDIDLHFTRIPQGQWGDKGEDQTQNGWDVFFLNTEPTWLLDEGSPEHPSLDRDDRDGEGPENVNLDDPNPCSWYAVGIHHFDDKGLDESLATVRIYINGKNLFQKLNIPLALSGTNGDFWYVAAIFWDGNTAYPFDVSEKFNNGAWIDDSPAVPQHYLDAAAELAPQCF